MANRNIPGAAGAEKPTPRRNIPGAPPPDSSKSSKKGKAPRASKQTTSTSANVKVPDATSAALIEKAPQNPNQVANGLKVTPTDLAEQAELQTALAAINTLQPSSSSSPNPAVASTPAQRVISDRIAELGGKSKNATITVAIDELKSLLSKVQVAESKAVGSKSSEGAGEKAKLVLLLQFLHLFNLFHPQQQGEMASFAPRSMPKALEMSTGQEVAALAKVYDQLANGPLEGGGGDALEVLANIEKGSEEQVLPDVTFEKVRKMVLALTAPPAAAAVGGGEAGKRDGLDGPQGGFVQLATSPSAGLVSFIQESELEPEGGQVEGVPDAKGPTKKGEQGGKGLVPGAEGNSVGGADGSAASAVKEPINTTETKVETKLNWAAMAEEDDDDLGEAPVFEPISTSTSALVTPAPGTPAGEPAAPTSKPAEGTLTSPKAKKKQAGAGAKGGSGRAGNGSANGRGTKQVHPPPTPKAPKVDEDGFILQESKKTKYLQSKQQQQQQQQRGGNGGARGGAKGAAGGGRGGRNNAGGSGARKDGRPNAGASAGAGAAAAAQ
ncbi:hypothetical protein NDA16_001009 [Ustilago loliicola]|nr:hypothetical protein NDA16_001009 [Ustilago loliicola]